MRPLAQKASGGPSASGDAMRFRTDCIMTHRTVRRIATPLILDRYGQAATIDGSTCWMGEADRPKNCFWWRRLMPLWAIRTSFIPKSRLDVLHHRGHVRVILLDFWYDDS